MYLIYQFYPSYIVPILETTETNVWKMSGQFSILEDSNVQLQRFIDSGVDVNYLRQLTDADPIPNDIPSP